MRSENPPAREWSSAWIQGGLVALILLALGGVAGYRLTHPAAPTEASGAITRLADTRFAPGLGVDPTRLVHGPGGVAWIDRRLGTEAESVTVGRRVWVRYAAYRPSGELVDESRAHREPFAVVVGTHGVTPAWDLGLLGMRVGGVRLILVPTAAAGEILAYRVELLQRQDTP